MSAEIFAKQTLAPLILRLALAAVFIYHGLDKILGKQHEMGANWATVQGTIPSEFARKLDTLARQEGRSAEDRDKIDYAHGQLIKDYANAAGTTPTDLLFPAAQLAVAWGELLGGAALLIGFLVRLASLGLIVIQAGAVYTVTWAQGFSVVGGGYEYNLVLIAVCLTLVCLGSGPLSFSGMLRRQRRAAASRAQQAQPPQPVSA
jgi:uncharacterized membrane protein YphA (DoxX/SURF4 family)